jgi:hypothetical protein
MYVSAILARAEARQGIKLISVPASLKMDDDVVAMLVLN